MRTGLGWDCGKGSPAVSRSRSRSQLTLWLNEKLPVARDVSYEGTRDLQGKWQKHQAFAAELAANRGWLEALEKVGIGGTRGENGIWEGAALGKGGIRERGLSHKIPWVQPQQFCDSMGPPSVIPRFCGSSLNNSTIPWVRFR